METIACGLQLLPAHIRYKEAAPWGLDALAAQQFPWCKLFFPLQEELRHFSIAETGVHIVGRLLACLLEHHNVAGGERTARIVCRVIHLKAPVNIGKGGSRFQRGRVDMSIVVLVHG